MDGRFQSGQLSTASQAQFAPRERTLMSAERDEPMAAHMASAELWARAKSELSDAELAHVQAEQDHARALAAEQGAWNDLAMASGHSNSAAAPAVPLSKSETAPAHAVAARKWGEAKSRAIETSIARDSAEMNLRSAGQNELGRWNELQEVAGRNITGRADTNAPGYPHPVAGLRRQ